MINVAFAFAPQSSKVGMKIPRIRHWTVGLHTSTEVDLKPVRCLSGDDSSMNMKELHWDERCLPATIPPSLLAFPASVSSPPPLPIITDTIRSETWTICRTPIRIRHKISTSQSHHWRRRGGYRTG